MTTATPGTDSPSAASILVVDDMEENHGALRAVLAPLGEPVVSACSGEEALKAMLRHEFAVVLLDVLMPGMDGFETAANIKRLDQTKDVPVILLTAAEADSEYAYKGYTVGAADFLTKPVDPWLLRTKVGVYLELHRARHRLRIQAEQLRRLGSAGHGTDAVRPEGVAERLRSLEELARSGDPEAPARLADALAALRAGLEAPAP